VSEQTTSSADDRQAGETNATPPAVNEATPAPQTDLPDDRPLLILPQPDLKGVHGWLRLFVIVRIYVDPTLTAILVVLSLVGWSSMVRSNASISALDVVQTIVSVCLTILGVKAGLALRDIKPRAVQRVRRWLITVTVWEMVFVIIATGFSLTRGRGIEDRMIYKVILSVGSLAIWYSYFKFSSRVKATYSDWNERGLIAERGLDDPNATTCITCKAQIPRGADVCPKCGRPQW
jgi:hypothetical protein